MYPCRHDFITRREKLDVAAQPHTNELNPGSCSPWNYRENWDFICRLGFETAGDVDRERWMNSPSVRRWWFGPDEDPVCPF